MKNMLFSVSNEKEELRLDAIVVKYIGVDRKVAGSVSRSNDNQWPQTLKNSEVLSYAETFLMTPAPGLQYNWAEITYN